jgi:hypothetical protein
MGIRERKGTCYNTAKEVVIKQGTLGIELRQHALLGVLGTGAGPIARTGKEHAVGKQHFAMLDAA